MIKDPLHIPYSYLCTATFILFLLPHVHSMPTTDMTREERIKILEALKESDAILEKSISGRPATGNATLYRRF